MNIDTKLSNLILNWTIFSYAKSPLMNWQWLAEKNIPAGWSDTCHLVIQMKSTKTGDFRQKPKPIIKKMKTDAGRSADCIGSWNRET
jgi:hypothetical protein